MNVQPKSIQSVELDSVALDPHQIDAVALHDAKITITPAAVARMESCRAALLATLDDGEPHYGVNTGFGALGRIKIDDGRLEELQTNLLRSHSTGVGDPLPRDVVRATMLLLAASLCRGHSGIRPCVVQLLVELLNHDITPIVPETGSVGASGDLAPLAHIGLVLLGEGEVVQGSGKISGGEALKSAGLKPVKLQSKEGLALINGTHLMAGRAALIINGFKRLFSAALAAAAMSVDTCRATDSTLDERVHAVRCQSGQMMVASRLRQLLAGSQVMQSHTEDDPRVQDPYSFRCCPAVLGAAWDAFEFFEAKVNAELAAVTDNPLIFSSGGAAEIISGGNFHGMPIALPLDVINISLSHIAGIAERRVFHMLSGHDAEAELPTFLTPQAGLQSGLMIVQYTAAACCNELIGLANPASVANLSTSAGMEDYNSFGPRSAAKAARALRLARSVVAIELLCASTGLDHHRPLKSGDPVEKAFASIRKEVDPLTEDRPPAIDILAIEQMINRGEFLFALED